MRDGVAVAEKIDIIRVAREAGVSIATVSRAFTLPDKVRKSTRDAIFAVVERIGYTPNARARNFRAAKTDLIIALVPEITDPFFSGILQGIECVARHHGYCVLIGEARHNPKAAARYAEMIAEGAADGIIAMHPGPRLPPGPAPVVSLCEVPPGCAHTSLEVDNFAAMHQMTTYLISAGHRHIAHVAAHVRSPSGAARQRGYRDAMRQAGLGGAISTFSVPEKSVTAGAALAERILAASLPISACACNSDELAIGLIQGFRDRGVMVPRDMSVSGFDGITFSDFVYPRLTTIVQPCEQMGRQAMACLLEVIRAPDTPVRHLVLPTVMVARDSVAPPRSAGAIRDAAD